MIVMEGLVESCESVIFDPATNWKALDDTVFAVPEVAPPAVIDPIDTKADWLLAEIVMVLAALPMPIFAPAEIDICPDEPLSDWT